jgi:drug/metabolite transporter (DMT)-like permease
MPTKQVRPMGLLFLAGYIVAIGVATYLLKVVLEDLSAYQVNLLMGAAMLVISVPAVLVADHTLAIPARHLPAGVLVATLMAGGSVFYALALQRLPAGPTAAIATSYVVIVVVLSALFLHERVDAVTVLGLVLTLAGVAVLSFRT